MRPVTILTAAITLAIAASLATPVLAGNVLRARGVAVGIAGTPLAVTPPRDWNRLGTAPGRRTERWTLDGEDLNDVTFFAGIEPGKPLIREANRKRNPLPRFTRRTLLVDIPELLEGTYRASRTIADFAVSDAQPDRFVGHDGIRFTFDYVDADELPRRGEARAAVVDGLLYMATLTAPRLHYFKRTLPAFQALADSATLD